MPSSKSDWAEPLGYVGALGDARFLVYRTCALERQVLNFTLTTSVTLTPSVGSRLVVDIFQVIANCLFFQYIFAVIPLNFNLSGDDWQ